LTDFFVASTGSMPSTKPNRLLLFILFVILQTNCFLFSQTSSYPIAEWAKKLGERNGPLISGVDEILPALAHKDSSEGASLFNQLERKASVSNKYFLARFAIAKAWWLHNYRRNDMKILLRDLASRALIAAYEANNDSLISFVSWQSGS